MTINFPARRSGTHFRGTPQQPSAPAAGRTLSRRTLLKLGAGSTALAAAGAYRLDKTTARTSLRRIADPNTTTRPVKQLTLVGTDGWVSMPPSAASGGRAFPDAVGQKLPGSGTYGTTV